VLQGDYLGVLDFLIAVRAFADDATIIRHNNATYERIRGNLAFSLLGELK
jgi:hypothetical protein